MHGANLKFTNFSKKARSKVVCMLAKNALGYLVKFGKSINTKGSKCITHGKLLQKNWQFTIFEVQELIENEC